MKSGPRVLVLAIVLCLLSTTLTVSSTVSSASSFPAAASSPSGGTATPGEASATVVASGLTNPRGFAFSPTVTRSRLVGYRGRTRGRPDRRWLPGPSRPGLPAYRIVFGAVTGVADVAYLDGQLYALLAGGNIDKDAQPNGVYRLDGNGGADLVADISSFIRDNPVANRPGDYNTDGQPYALLAMGDAFWVTEGNSNQVLRVGLDGSVSRIADLSSGHPIPTGIAPAPDGGAYIGFLTSAPYIEGTAKVIHVAPDGTVKDVWTGLSLITALSVGPDGALYALEMATGYGDDPSAITTGTGRVVRMIDASNAEPVVTGLALPSNRWSSVPAVRSISGHRLLVRRTNRERSSESISQAFGAGSRS